MRRRHLKVKSGIRRGLESDRLCLGATLAAAGQCGVISGGGAASRQLKLNLNSTLPQSVNSFIIHLISEAISAQQSLPVPASYLRTPQRDFLKAMSLNSTPTSKLLRSNNPRVSLSSNPFGTTPKRSPGSASARASPRSMNSRFP